MDSHRTECGCPPHPLQKGFWQGSYRLGETIQTRLHSQMQSNHPWRSSLTIGSERGFDTKKNPAHRQENPAELKLTATHFLLSHNSRIFIPRHNRLVNTLWHSRRILRWSKRIPPRQRNVRSLHHRRNPTFPTRSDRQNMGSQCRPS